MLEGDAAFFLDLLDQFNLPGEIVVHGLFLLALVFAVIGAVLAVGGLTQHRTHTAGQRQAFRLPGRIAPAHHRNIAA